MQQLYHTDRLELSLVKTSDADFIFELLNTEGWIKFIGDRKIETREDAQQYIQKILNNPQMIYWVARLKKRKIPIGMISFIKRDYLDHHDIGFAFLPAYFSKGYATEATKRILSDVMQDPNHKIILATTMPGNGPSIRLLEKAGFHFKKEIENEQVRLLLYSVKPG